MQHTSCSFPYEISRVDDRVNTKLLQDFTGERTGFVQVGPKKYLFPIKYQHEAQQYYDVEMRKDDVLVASFPRSGTTLTQEMVWMIGNDLNFKEASKQALRFRFPFLEFDLLMHEELKAEEIQNNAHSRVNQQLLENMVQSGWKLLPTLPTSRRFIKTHFPMSLLPRDWHRKKCKTIYVARNPKQVVVSYFHLNKLFRTLGFQRDFNTTFWEYFEDDLLPWMPYWSHVEEAWHMRNEPHVLFLFYEDILNDMKGSIRKVANFLDKSMTDSQINELEQHLSFEQFRNNASVNSEFLTDLKITRSGVPGFIRSGKTSSSQTDFSDELRRKCDKWIEANMARTNLHFPTV